MSAYPLRVVEPESNTFAREHVADLFDHVASAIRKGYLHDLRHSIQWALVNLQTTVDAEAVPSLYEWIEGEYTDRLRRCATRTEMIALTHELQKLWGLVDQLEREARDLDEHWGEDDNR